MLQAKILHNTFSDYLYLAKFIDNYRKCSFCNNELTHASYHCIHIIITFWTQMGNYKLCNMSYNIKIECKNVIIYFEHEIHIF